MRRSSLAQWILIFIFGCGNDAPEVGQIKLAVSAAPEVERVHLLITAADMDPIEHDLYRDPLDNTLTALLLIKAGLARNFNAAAYDQNGDLLYTGSATTDVPANTTTIIIITMQSVVAGAPMGVVSISFNFNNAPVLSLLSVSPNPGRSNRTMRLKVEAADPDGDQLSYQWSVVDAQGVSVGQLSQGNTDSAIWHAPNQSGNYTVSVRVDDGNNGVTMATLPLVVQ